HAQHLRLALRPVEIDRVPVGGLGDADVLCEPRTLVQQLVDLLVDRIDPLPDGLQVHRRHLASPGGRARGRFCFFSFAGHRSFARAAHTSRADSTPSILRMHSTISAGIAPSASMIVYAY